MPLVNHGIITLFSFSSLQVHYIIFKVAHKDLFSLKNGMIISANISVSEMYYSYPLYINFRYDNLVSHGEMSFIYFDMDEISFSIYIQSWEFLLSPV